ncbi:MAG: hypothetical protein K2O89_00495 [Clostridia bacterium]|nr:hypothetical protein [Clostridia bacterium]
MFKNLRILFCILSVACVAVTIFIFVYFLWWGFLPLAGACGFAALMFLCKRMQESEELKKNPPPPAGDFITGKAENKEKKDGE